ncbi:uncharacterized protein LOC124291393 [Haliotis rubra]|uniref:uncharacterized protein LOC124291393 n=1 Tax=Haliotis rubra TaxID=36100 RepID=UPI001EE57F68|nr:uncharacterized protein LOC124291393 [Haliotis rubra]
MQSVVVKVFYEREGTERPEVRRFPGPNDSAPTYAFVHDKVKEVFKKLEAGTFNMYWKDGEGDFVTCSSEQEMQEALCSVKESVLRIYIRDASPVVSEDDEWDFDPRMQGWGRGWGRMGGMRGAGAMPMRGMPPHPHFHRWMKRMKRWNKKNKCHESRAEGEVTPGEEFETNTADKGAQAENTKDAPDNTEGRGDGNDTEMKADDQSGTQKCGRGKKGRGKCHKHDKHHAEDSQTKDDDTSGSSDEDMPPPSFGHPGMFAGGPMQFWGMMGMHPHAWGEGCWNRRGGWRRGGRGGCKRSWECLNEMEPRDMGFAGWEDGRGDPREGCRGRFRGHPRGEGHGHGHGHGHAQDHRRRCRRQNEADEPMEACIEEMRNVKATDDVITLGDENEAPKM